MKSIQEKMLELGNMKTWMAAVEVAGLNELLESNKNYTIFAPTDHAFTKLERETLEDLLQNTAYLVATISYHIVEGKITTTELPQRSFLRTLFGDELVVDIGRSLNVNHASIVQPNIECNNGVIHTIDKVLVVSRLTRTRPLATQPHRCVAEPGRVDHQKQPISPINTCPTIEEPRTDQNPPKFNMDLTLA